MFAYICIQYYVCMYTLFIYGCTHGYMYTCAYVCMYYVCVRARTFMCLFVFVSYDLRLYILTYARMHACRPYAL